jgi:integrase
MQTLLRSITDTELQLLISRAFNPIHKAIFIILADTGLRVAELCALRVSDLWMLDEPLNLLEVRAAIAKNHQPRSIPLSPRVHDSIRNLYHHHWTRSTPNSLEYAFHCHKPTSPTTPRTIQRIVSKYGLAILHRRLTPHMLRHTFATRLITKCNIRVVQQLLGHSSLTSTQVYTHPSTTDLQTAINALNAPTSQIQQPNG